MDGKMIARPLYDDGGRLVHSQAQAEEAKGIGLLPPGVDAALYQPLTRNRPIVLTVPMDRSLREGDLKDLPAPLSTLALDMRVEYLGQTEFDGVQVAGHRVTGRMTPLMVEGFELRMRVDAFRYSDATRGVPLYMEMNMSFSARQGAQRLAEERTSYRQLLDRTASSGF